jgi:hypothetical protein
LDAEEDSGEIKEGRRRLVMKNRGDFDASPDMAIFG